MLKPIRLRSTAVFAIAVLTLTAGCDQISGLMGGGEDAEVVEEAPASPAPDAAPVSDNPFRDAVNAATNAANLAQTAKTPEEWQAVAKEWKTAIDLMKAVPEGDANREVAQQKATEYQKNLDYATQNAGS